MVVSSEFIVDEDEGVKEERERVGKDDGDLLRVFNLTKQYWSKEKILRDETQTINDRQAGFEEIDPTEEKKEKGKP